LAERVILRLAYKRVEPKGEVSVERKGLFGEESWRITEYIVALDSLIVQRPEGPDAYRYEGQSITIAPQPHRQFCRWHNGPLWEKDEPWKRLYCVVESDSYCRQHKRSLRALYELCLSSNSEKTLPVCKKIDEVGRTSYTVYLTDAGAGRVKVGVTRSFRLLERLAEQAHNVATPLYTTDSVYEARRIELTISKKKLASQVKARRPVRVPLAEAASRLSSTAERIARELGISWEGRLIRVVSPVSNYIFHSKPAKASALEGATVGITGYWGGYIVAESNGIVYVVNTRELMHRDSIIIPGLNP